MEPPDQRALQNDLTDGPFLAGVADGRWGLIAEEEIKWPAVLFWVAAIERNGAPSRFIIRLDCAGYPIVGPTGNFWDAQQKVFLAPDKRPKGKGRVQVVFRTDWNGATAFYHPYDRTAAGSHSDWSGKYPERIWDHTKTIVDFLSVIFDLLHSGEYNGI